MAKKNVYFDNNTLDIHLFVAASILLLATIVALLIICKNTKLKSLVTSPTLS